MSEDQEGERTNASRSNSRLSVLLKLATIGAVMIVAAGIFGFVAGWFSPTRLTQSQMVAAFDDANGKHPGFRLNHAKGLCVSGVFDSSGAATSLSTATVFAAGPVPVIGRISLAGGMPLQADEPATVRAMALRFLPHGGQEWRIATVNIPVFVVNSAQGFHDQTLASAADPATGKPDPLKMQAFLAQHPEAVKAMAIIKQAPKSSGFVDDSYFGLDAFRFVNSAGTSVPVRWSLVPAEPLVQATVQSASTNNNYLFDAFIAAVSAHPVQWHLLVTIAQPGDPTDDATLPWPSDRRQVDVGTVRIDHVSSEATGRCTDVNYDPTVLPSGIEPSDDPLLSARSAVYARSFTSRAEERAERPPSAITTQDVLAAAQ